VLLQTLQRVLYRVAREQIGIGILHFLRCPPTGTSTPAPPNHIIGEIDKLTVRDKYHDTEVHTPSGIGMRINQIG
jgi:hypothetical protein